MWHDRYMRTGALALGVALVVLTAGSLGHPDNMDAPKAPRELKATADGPYAVDLDWKRSKNTEEYKIYRDGNRVGETERTEYRDEGLQPATTYEYRVSAIDDDGDESDLSDAVQVTTDGTAPTTPTDLVATAVGPNRIDLEWSPSDDESGIAFYRVFREGAEVAGPSTTIYEDSNLAPETTYEYRVSAVNEDGDESDLSDPASATTLSVEAGPPPPENVTATEVGFTRIFVTWNPPSGSESVVAGYNVYREGDFVGFVVATAFTDTGLSPETTYRYTVSSVDDRGIEGERSEEVSATTAAPRDLIPPAPPTGLRIVGS
ncbi:MAG: fibronectin type III domain-containing protein [Gemmatimonadota bacterium]